MADYGDGGGQGARLDEDERDFLRRCSDHPEDVAVEDIFARIESDDEDERKLGARGLTQYSQADPAGLAPYGERIVDLLDDEDDDVRGSAIVVVQRLVAADLDAFAEPPVEPLLARLGKEDQPGSKRVAGTLADLLDADDPRLTEAVDRTLDLFDGEKPEAGSAIQALSELGNAYPEPVVGRLTDRLDDDNPEVRKYAVRTLATLSEDNTELVAPAAEDLIALLDEDDDYTREHALGTLVDVATREPAALEPAIPRLTALVDDDHHETRRGAVRVLAQLGRADVDIDAAVDRLRGRLDDDDKLVRRDACYTLGILRAEDALADIRARTDDYDLEFAAVAESAIERIETGESDPPMADLEPGEIFVARN